MIVNGRKCDRCGDVGCADQTYETDVSVGGTVLGPQDLCPYCAGLFRKLVLEFVAERGGGRG